MYSTASSFRECWAPWLFLSCLTSARSCARSGSNEKINLSRLPKSRLTPARPERSRAMANPTRPEQPQKPKSQPAPEPAPQPQKPKPQPAPESVPPPQKPKPQPVPEPALPPQEPVKVVTRFAILQRIEH